MPDAGDASNAYIPILRVFIQVPYRQTFRAYTCRRFFSHRRIQFVGIWRIQRPMHIYIIYHHNHIDAHIRTCNRAQYTQLRTILHSWNYSRQYRMRMCTKNQYNRKAKRALNLLNITSLDEVSSKFLHGEWVNSSTTVSMRIIYREEVVIYVVALLPAKRKAHDAGGLALRHNFINFRLTTVRRHIYTTHTEIHDAGRT